jgi:hypothetical protein
MMEMVILRLLTGRLCLSEWTLLYSLDLLRHAWAYCESRVLYKGVKMSDLPLVAAFFRDRARTIRILFDYVKQSRESACDCISSGHFHAKAAEAASICKIVCTSFAHDTAFCLRKVLGSQSMFTEARLGPTLDVFNGCLFAEGDVLILEKKIVFDATTGRTGWLPLKLPGVSYFRDTLKQRKSTLINSFLIRASVVARYFFYMASLALIGAAKARTEDQLLRNFAWARAHIKVLECWNTAGGNSRRNGAQWLQSYSNCLLKWPVPVIF